MCPELKEELNCTQECSSDADCPDISKCCRAGCAAVCRLPNGNAGPGAGGAAGSRGALRARGPLAAPRRMEPDRPRSLLLTLGNKGGVAEEDGVSPPPPRMYSSLWCVTAFRARTAGALFGAGRRAGSQAWGAPPCRAPSLEPSRMALQAGGSLRARKDQVLARLTPPALPQQQA